MRTTRPGLSKMWSALQGMCKLKSVTRLKGPRGPLQQSLWTPRWRCALSVCYRSTKPREEVVATITLSVVPNVAAYII